MHNEAVKAAEMSKVFIFEIHGYNVSEKGNKNYLRVRIPKSILILRV